MKYFLFIMLALLSMPFAFSQVDLNKPLVLTAADGNRK